MSHHTHTANPFYASRIKRVAPRTEARDRPVYARLPLAPRNASPVPGLTSLYHFHRAGEYGDRSYPGNCGGNLIKDLLRYFKVRNCFDPMTGSGTCRDVCKELGIYCWSSDMHQGVDACDASQFPRECFEFAWIHPPYWRQKLYTDDPRCLSRTPTLAAFLECYRLLIRELRRLTGPRRQTGHPDGGLLRPGGGFRPPDVPYQTARLRSRSAAALHRHHSFQPRSIEQPEGVPLVVHPRPARHVHGFRAD